MLDSATNTKRERVVAVIQARMGSSRLPGKVLLELAGKPTIDWVVAAARAIPGVDEVAIATSTQSSDDAIVDWCENSRTACVRGPEDDVLRRYQLASKELHADAVVRLTADCPLLDPQVCGATLALFQRTGADFATSADPPTWPDGLSCEVLDAKVLAIADEEARRPSEREHVCPFVSHRRHRFSVHSYICPIPGLESERWTLDTQEDLAFLRALFAELPTQVQPYTYLDVLEALDRVPDLRGINAGFQRNAGAARARELEGAAVVSQSFANATRMRQDPISGAQNSSIDVGAIFSQSNGAGIQKPDDTSHIFLTHGRLGRVWDVDGSRYVDFIGGRPAMILGHADPDVEQRCRTQLTHGEATWFSAELAQRVAAGLLKLFEGQTVRFFATADAAMRRAAVHAAMRSGRRHVLIHGQPVSALRDLALEFVPVVDGEDGDATLLPETELPAAVVVRPSAGDALTQQQFTILRNLADRHGAPLILDESETAFRIAPGGVQAEFGIRADVSVVGGALGNGRAIAALVASRPFSDNLGPGELGVAASALAAADVVLDRSMDGSMCANLAKTGAQLRSELSRTLDACGLTNVVDLSGFPAVLSYAVRLEDRMQAGAAEATFDRELRRRGVLADGALRLCAAHDEFDLRQLIVAFEYAAAEVSRFLAGPNADARI